MTREADNNAKFGCQAHYRDISKLLAWIGQACRGYTKGEVTWAHAGSLSHVRQQLIETLAFTAGDEPEAIEERLAALAADSQSKKR
jgi:hypothetical protein